MLSLLACVAVVRIQLGRVSALEAQLKSRQQELVRLRSSGKDPGIAGAVAEAYNSVRSDRVIARLLEVVEQLPRSVQLTSLRWNRTEGKDEVIGISGSVQSVPELGAYLGGVRGVRNLKIAATDRGIRFDAQLSAVPDGTGGKQ